MPLGRRRMPAGQGPDPMVVDRNPRVTRVAVAAVV
jgi:hypothetical protein